MSVGLPVMLMSIEKWTIWELKSRPLGRLFVKVGIEKCTVRELKSVPRSGSATIIIPVHRRDSLLRV